MKIDFSKMKIYTDITKKFSFIQDSKLDFANMLYLNTNGIIAHSLAMKIYNTNGPVEIDEAEKELIQNVANQFCVPAFIDAINEQLNNQDND